MAVVKNKETLYLGTIGQQLDFELEEDGAPISLTNATVTLYLYTIGGNTLTWNGKSVTVDVEANGTCHYTTVNGDVATAGEYWSILKLVYSGGNVRYVAGPSFEFISITEPETLVTCEELRDFINIPEENAMAENIIKDYISTAEAQVYYDATALRSTTDAKYIKLKKQLIKLKAAILYFMNSDEGNIDPNKRNQKIDQWTAQYNKAVESLGEAVSADPTSGSGLYRRSKSSSYSNASAPPREGTPSESR